MVIHAKVHVLGVVEKVFEEKHSLWPVCECCEMPAVQGKLQTLYI